MAGSVHYNTRSRRWFVSIYWEGTRYRIWRDPVTNDPFWSEGHAQKILFSIRNEVDRGEFSPRYWMPESPLLLKEYFQRWIENKEASAKTLRDYRTAFNSHIIPVLGTTKDIRRIRAGEIKTLYRELNLAPKTKYNVVSALRTMLNDAWRDEDISGVPPFPKMETGAGDFVEYLTLEQQDQILAEIPEADRPIFEFGMEFGLRVQEVRAIKKDCLTENEITIRRAFVENDMKETTKTGDKGVRTFALTTYARKLIEGLKTHLGPFVFVRKDGLPYTNKNMNAIWDPACKKAGITIKLYNAMRHSLACQLLDQGEDIETVRQILGHTNIKMTMRYTRRRVAPMANAALERRRNIITFGRELGGNIRKPLQE
jgi:integrase